MNTTFHIHSSPMSLSNNYITNMEASIKLYFGNSKVFKGKCSEMEKFLDQLEIKRMNRFLADRDKLCYLAVHALVKRQLQIELSCNCDEIKIQYFKNKKPFIVGGELDFNISHSVNFFSFIIADQPNLHVGIDIEALRPLPDLKGISFNYLSLKECDYIFSVPQSDQLLRFYEIWTRKEAFLKMIGLGLFANLSEITVAPGTHICTFDNISENFKKDVFIYTGYFPDFVISVCLSEKRCLDIIEVTDNF